MKVGAGQKSTASPNVTEAKWVPMGTFFSFWVHFVNNLLAPSGALVVIMVY